MDSIQKMFFKEVKKYPVLSNKKQIELWKKYKENGDQESYQKLINHNLRLCVLIANKYKNQVQNMTFMDLIQENSITLMRAIDLYNIDKEVNLSTYIIKAMDNQILRIIDNTDKTIRKPVHIEILSIKYKQFLRKTEQKYNRKPTKEEIIEELKITEKQLQNLENSFKTEVRSLDKKISSDEDSKDLINFIKFEEKNYDTIENQYDLNLLKNKCKNILTLEEYYIIYYRYISENRKTQEEIGKEFCISKQRISQKEETALKKLNQRLKYQKNRYNNDDKLDPLSISQIIILSELKRKLTKEEYFILYSMIKSNEEKNENNYSQLLGINIDDIKELKEYLKDIFLQYTKEENINSLSKKYHQKYTTEQILDLDITTNYKDTLNYYELDQYFKQVDYNDIINSSYYKKLSLPEQILVKQYYHQNQDILTTHQINQIERELTLNKLGYLKQEKPLYTIKQFRKLYEEYNTLLNDFQKEKLQHILFPNHHKQNINKYDKQRLLDKLISIDLRINSFFENQLTHDQIKKVLRKNKDLLTEEEKNLIFKYYGIHQERVSINDLAIESNETKEVVHDRIFNLKNRILYKYYNITSNKKEEVSPEDRNLYQLYLQNSQYEFSEDTKRLLSMYLSGKTYEEISNSTNLSRTKVSNVITEGLRKCEFYKYGINLPLLISEEDIQFLFEKNDYNEENRKLIIERFLNSKTPTELSKKYNINIREIHKLNQKFYKQYLKLKCPTIPLNVYKEELEKHPCESILTEEEKKMVSLKYGIKSKYNETGEIKSNQEIDITLPMLEGNSKNRLTNINNKLREKLLNIKQPNYGIISRKQMEKLLKDKNLPISEKEKDIICHTNELEEYKYMTEEELSEKYHEKASSIKRRYNRAILSIKKYQDKSLGKQIDYDKDIKPIEKYFSEYDRKLLKMYYKQNLTEEKLAEKLNITKFQSRQKLIKLRLDVAEILNDEIVAKKFDFDYARQVLENDDLPLYYENKDLVIDIYKKVTGEIGTKKYTIKEIEHELKGERKSTSVSKYVYSVMLAVEKYKKGIRKIPTLSEQEIEEFYEKNKQFLSKELITICENQKKNKRIKRKVSSILTYEILKTNHKNTIKINDISKEFAYKIMKDKNHILTESCKNNIKNYFQISERELMSGKEKMKVLKILAPLYQKVSVNKRLQKI